jgi:hypothetical protein
MMSPGNSELISTLNSNTAPYAKDKIGRHLSYPLKFNEVVLLLSPAVEQLDIQVGFWGFQAPRPNEKRERYEIIQAGYWSHFEAPWRVLIRPVPRILRSFARSLLIPAATDRVRDWLLTRPFKSRDLRVYFCPTKEAIEYEPPQSIKFLQERPTRTVS